MKQALKRILSFAFVLILVVSLAAPAFAAGKVNTLDGNVTISVSNYSTSSSGKYAVTLFLAYGDKKFSIDKNKIKLTKGTAEAALAVFLPGCYGSNSSWSEKMEWKNGSKWQTQTSRGKYYNYAIGFYAKPGTCKVTYYVGSKKHTAAVTITDKYQNPVKTMTLTGVNGGKSFPVKKDQGYGTLTLNATVKNAKLKVVPARNWKLTSMYIEDETTGVEYYLRSGSGYGPSMMAGGLSSGILSCGKLVKGHEYYIGASFFNSKTFMQQSVSYRIQPNS